AVLWFSRDSKNVRNQLGGIFGEGGAAHAGTPFDQHDSQVLHERCPIGETDRDQAACRIWRRRSSARRRSASTANRWLKNHGSRVGHAAQRWSRGEGRGASVSHSSGRSTLVPRPVFESQNPVALSLSGMPQGLAKSGARTRCPGEY